MKKTIEGLTYNTATADRIAEYSWGQSASDFGYFEEELYVTSKGAYFLHGSGGPRSPYAETLSARSWGSGETIVPMTEQEAFDWCQKRDQEDAIEAHFEHLASEA
jgi:hypothetical protein